MPDPVVRPPFPLDRPYRFDYEDTMTMCWMNKERAQLPDRCRKHVPRDIEHIGLCPEHLEELRDS